MKKITTYLFFLISLLLGEYYPIIFVHRHNDDGSVITGWNTWLLPNSAMKRLLEEGYKGYTRGRPLNCTKNSSLIPTGGDTRKFYNFSF